MRADDFPGRLSEALLPGLRDCASQLASEPTGQVVAFCIYCASGCQGIGVAAHTLDALASRNAVVGDDARRRVVNTVGAMEWSRMLDSSAFSQANALVDAFYDTLFDGEFEDCSLSGSASTRQLQEFAYERFMPGFIDAIRTSRDAGVFAAPAFAKDLLLGLQFSDPYGTAWDLMESASAAVNSEAWHRQVAAYCDLGRR